MQVYLIKILGILIVTMCCIIATYTDVKSQIIPNKLTFTTIIFGILLVGLYFFINKDFNIVMYLFSISIVFCLSYVLWKLGVWAGGDVKLFTALSTLLIPEFMDILPKFNIFGINFPFGIFSMSVPTFLVIFNSIISIIPLVSLYVTLSIIKNKHNLMDKLITSFNFKEVFLSLNSLIISYIIISEFGLYHVFVKIIFIIVLSIIISKIMKYDLLLFIFSILIIVQQLITRNIIQYINEFILISTFCFIKNIYKKGLIKESLTNKIPSYALKEGMILQYPLYYKNNIYYFNKTPWYHFKENKGKLICSNKASGLTDEEIELLKELFENSNISIKKGLPFAPFIFCGLLITLIIGNTFKLISMMMVMFL